MEEWTHGIEEVTEMAGTVKKAVGEGRLEGACERKLVAKGLVPMQRPYEVGELRRILEMNSI